MNQEFFYHRSMKKFGETNLRLLKWDTFCKSERSGGRRSFEFTKGRFQSEVVQSI